jgi:hypothetical protein
VAQRIDLLPADGLWLLTHGRFFPFQVAVSFIFPAFNVCRAPSGEILAIFGSLLDQIYLRRDLTANSLFAPTVRRRASDWRFVLAIFGFFMGFRPQCFKMSLSIDMPAL